MIISASRRTDIPAFFSDWLMERIRSGYCVVPNPFNRKQISRIPLEPKDVEAIVFWSKNPKPLIRHLDEIDKRGFRYYFQYTLNNYSREFEPNLPSLDRRINTFSELSKRIGSKRVIWRYDPIIISSISDYEFHIKEFEKLATKLHEMTFRVVISIVDYYKKTERKFGYLEKQGVVFQKDTGNSAEMNDLLRDISNIAKHFNLEIFSCAEARDFSDVGIPAGRCIDGDLLNSLWNFNSNWKKDPGQRGACACVLSRDIGMPDTCLHGCTYCYSTVSEKVAKQNWNRHNPKSPVMIGDMPEKSLDLGPKQFNLL